MTTRGDSRNRRRVLATAALATAALALVSLLAGPVTAAATGTAKSVPAADRKALERVLANAFRALPTPAKEFREDRSSVEREIAWGTSARAVATKAPVEARQVRVYERRAGEGEEAEVVGLEVRVYVNQERSLPEPLGSEGGTLETFTHDGLPATRVMLAGVGGRVALPLTPGERDEALTVIRLHVGADDAEPYLVQVAQGRRPDRTPWDDRPARKASEVRTIVVEFQGPRSEVERLANATPAAPLRALLMP